MSNTIKLIIDKSKKVDEENLLNPLNNNSVVDVSKKDAAEEKLLTNNNNNSLAANSSKHLNAKPKLSIDESIKFIEIENGTELLGSVTTQNCRTSARVIQKMKENLVRPTTPPINEREQKLKDEKHLQKTPSQLKSTIWTNLERNFFFDALNEYGKDFEAVANYINTKLKRKNPTDQCFKTKEQIRTTYYQTFHKLSKYIKFSDDVKKPIQELYALVNYGEMRRKLQFVSEKNCMKIRDLVYKGYVTIRSKGKNIRIKTPSCKSLRKLNQLEDWLEDIKLPAKVDVCLRPASIETWSKVQQIAQNPCVRTSVPLQKKLSVVLKTFQIKWRSRETKLSLEASKISNLSDIKNIHPNAETPNTDCTVNEPQLCLRPLHDAVIHRPIVSITEFLSSFNICLNSYEERIGARKRGETLCHDSRFPNKRQRTDSGSGSSLADKKSPDTKKIKVENTPDIAATSYIKDDSLQIKDRKDNIKLDPVIKESPTHVDSFEQLQTLETEFPTSHDVFRDGPVLCETDSNSDLENINNSDGPGRTMETPPKPQPSNTKKSNSKCISKKNMNVNLLGIKNNMKPLINDDVLKKIRKGWTISDCGDTTIGDLYIVFGADSKLLLEYTWIDEALPIKKDNNSSEISTPMFTTGILSYNGFTSLSAGPLEKKQQIETINRINDSSLGNKLKQLLLIANLSDRMKKKSCQCGHTCDKLNKLKVDLATNSALVVNKPNENDVFRQPLAPFRKPTFSIDSFKNSYNSKNSRFQNGNPLSRQLVQRVLPVQPGVNQSYDIVDVKILQNNFHNSKHISTISSPNQFTENRKTKVSESISKNITETNNSSYQPQNKVHQETKSVQVEIDVNQNQNINKCSKNIQSDIDLSPIMELSLPSPLPVKYPDDDNTNDIFINIPPMSPSNILKETPSESRWIEENLNDFSLSSLLGHLDEINNGRDITTMDPTSLSSNLSVISESSVDYMSKFAEIAASMQTEEKYMN